MFKRICAVTALALLATGAPASASTPEGAADAGSADYVRDGSRVSIPAVAACDVQGPTTNSSGPRAEAGVRFGSGTSSCATTVVNPGTGATKTVSTASGTEFELSALTRVGGPSIRVAGYRVTCTATKAGTDVTWTFDGMSGLSPLPSPVPSNYLREVRSSAGSLLATVMFNEVTVPSPNDGSIALTMMRIRFQPGSDMTGEVRVGDTACSPTA
ncbi:hypothetical protein ACTG9Q_27930 [Actinokineospora sp. 24-640]